MGGNRGGAVGGNGEGFREGHRVYKVLCAGYPWNTRSHVSQNPGEITSAHSPIL